jgi:hypothetical protein
LLANAAGVRHRVEHPLDGRPHVRRGGPARFARRGLDGTGEIEEVRAFRVVQTQRIRQRVEDGLGGAAEVAPLSRL